MNSALSFSKRIAWFVFIITSGLFLPPQLPAQSSEALDRATITFADGASLQVRGREQFRTVGIGAGETVSIEMSASSALGAVVVLQALDGGAVSNHAEMLQDGSAVFAFQAGTQAGVYRVLLSSAGREFTFRFWVSDLQNPEANPVVLTPEG